MNLRTASATLLIGLTILAGRCGACQNDTSKHRTILSLNGQWEIGESLAPDSIPADFGHIAPVPGLTHSAVPSFPDVDQYQSRELLANLVGQGLLPKADYASLGGARGVTHQPRNYFWYRKRFRAPPKSEVALLKLNKAQFGAVVYLNGIRIGEHDPCFTSASFDVTSAIRWAAQNVVIVRIGAHPGVLPPSVSQGTDFEKNRWTPGIYDDVSLLTMNNPVISEMQVAPKLAYSEKSVDAITIETELRNYSDEPVQTMLQQEVFERLSQKAVSKTVEMQVEVPARAVKRITQTLSMSGAHRWSPEDPFLYRLVTSTSGDKVVTQFGMREFRFDTPTQRAYLNGRPYFLRGSNITAHRFFEDPQVGNLPWDEAWLHRLLVEIPKEMHWNAFRFCIGPVPDRWLEIADESGLLIENEYMVWVGDKSWDWPPPPNYDIAEMTTEFTEWMRDNWNHPSVAIWDASNESKLPEFTTKLIPAVRSLDLSNRPWEDSYNSPAGPDDPVEDHQYLLFDMAMGERTGKSAAFKLSDFEQMLGPAATGVTSKTGHAMILNEYGWLWLNRDGTPTQLTKRLYPLLLGDQNTTENRYETLASLLGAETEFWRAYRRYAGVLQFVYLTASDPKAFTSDNFLDVKTLTLEPHYSKAMEQAFSPLGVYLNFWRDVLPADETGDYTVAMVNDEDRPRTGTLRLAFVDENGSEVVAQEIAFELGPLGAQTYNIQLGPPPRPGTYSLRASAAPVDNPTHPTISQRKVALQAARGPGAKK